MISAATNSHILVDTMMNRADAQTYCRSRYTDMSSITSEEDNVQISSLLQPPTPGEILTENGTDTTDGLFSSPEAWIGLCRFFWGWSDHNNSPYRRWGKKQPNENVNCVIMDSSSADWYRQKCDEKFSFLCYKSESSVTAESDPAHPLCANQVLCPLQPAKLQHWGRWRFGWAEDLQTWMTRLSRTPSCSRWEDRCCVVV